MTIHSNPWRRRLLVAALAWAPASASLATIPLDVQDPTPRTILVERENSTDRSVVGVSYGPPVEASYSASGNVGTLVMPIASHETMRSDGGLVPDPGTFSTLTIEIDLTTLEVTSQTATGTLLIGGTPGYGYAFTQNPLTSNGTVGYITGNMFFVSPFICTSQAEVDALCVNNPALRGETCEFVAGAGYDAASGKVNLVGDEEQIVCPGGCLAPNLHFPDYGDLRFSETGAVVPSAGPIALWMLGGAVLLSARGFLARPRRN